MTPYQQLEKSLLSYGWTKAQGKGDHIKFTKSGIPTIVTVSINTRNEGRDLMNAIANIRRWIPDFQIGKPAKSKERKAEDDYLEMLKSLTDEQREFRQRHWYITVGETVRYVSVEKGDYDKLSDDSSVMNIPYLVKEIRNGISERLGSSSSGKLFVLSEEDEIVIGHPQWGDANVHPSDLASWETQPCSFCGKTMPLSALVKDPGAVADEDVENEFVCEKCRTEFETRIWPDVEKAVESLNKIVFDKRVDSKKFPENILAYMAEANGNSTKSMVYWKTASEELGDFSKELYRRRSEFLKTYSGKTYKKKPEKITAFQVWNRFRGMAIALMPKRMENVGERVSSKETTSIIASWSYSIEKSGNLNVFHVHVSANDGVGPLLTVADLLEDELDHGRLDLFGDEPFALYLTSAKDGLRQWMNMYYTEKRGNELDKFIETVRKNVSAQDFRDRMAILLLRQQGLTLSSKVCQEMMETVLSDLSREDLRSALAENWGDARIEKDAVSLRVDFTYVFESENDARDVRTYSKEIKEAFRTKMKDVKFRICVLSERDSKNVNRFSEKFVLGGDDFSAPETAVEKTDGPAPEQLAAVAVVTENSGDGNELASLSLDSVVSELERRGIVILGLRTVRRVSMEIDLDSII